MNRSTWKIEYRNARNVCKFQIWIDNTKPSIGLLSIAYELSLPAWKSACRWGDPLRFPVYRRDGRYRSRLSGTPV